MSRGNYLSDTVGAIAGVAFAALLFLAIASLDPLKGATDAELIAWWSSSSHLRENVISMYLMLASVPCFLLFLVTLRGRLAKAENEDAPLSSFVFAAGVCFSAAVLIGGSARGLVAHSVKFGDETLPGPDTLRYVTALWSTIFTLVAIPAAAITLAAASWLVVRSRVMAAWVGWAGFAVAGVIAVATPLLVGPFALPLLMLWVIATSVELWRTREVEANQRPNETHMTRTGDVAIR